MSQFLLEKILVIIYLQTCFKVNSNNKYKKKKQTHKKFFPALYIPANNPESTTVYWGLGVNFSELG